MQSENLHVSEEEFKRRLREIIEEDRELLEAIGRL
jgi:hypothetical protein